MRHGGRRLCSARIASGLEADLPAHDRMTWDDEPMVTFAGIALRLIEDAIRWLVLLFRSTEVVRAENLFLRRQLALFIDRGVRPRRVDAATGSSQSAWMIRFAPWAWRSCDRRSQAPRRTRSASA